MDADRLGVKLRRSAPFAVSLPCVKEMGYGMGRHGWVVVALDDASSPGEELLLDWVTQSFVAVAPKTLAAQIAPPAGAS